MITPDTSLADLRLMTRGKPIDLALDYLFAQDHESRVAAVQKGVDAACNQLEQHKNKKQKMDEDQITLQICEMLFAMSFPAFHDASVGGHCDIVITGNEQFLWLAEAKIHDSYSWLDKGFRQLSTRYSTGVIGQDNGEIIIYCYTQNAKVMLDKWKVELISRNSGVIIEASPCGNPLIFLSRHTHDSSGLSFQTRHKAIALYWDPKDK